MYDLYGNHFKLINLPHSNFKWKDSIQLSYTIYLHYLLSWIFAIGFQLFKFYPISAGCLTLKTIF